MSARPAGIISDVVADGVDGAPVFPMPPTSSASSAPSVSSASASLPQGNGPLARPRRVHIRDVGIFGLFVAIFAMALKPVVDNDVFWHLATGRYIWTTGRIPHADPFSWTAPGRAWIAHEWLTETCLYPLYAHGGYATLTLVFAAVIAGAFAVSYATARLLGAARLPTAAITLLAAVASSHTWGVRPQMLSLLLIAVAVWLFTRAYVRGQRRLVWVLPALMLLWVNLHGGFIFGLALIGLYALGQTVVFLRPRLRLPSDSDRGFEGVSPFQLWAVFLASLAVCLVNPNGLRGLVYPFSYLGDNASMRYVAEWVRPDFHQLQYQYFGLLLVALGVGALGAAFSTRRPRVTELLLIVLFTYLGLRSVRNINLFCVVVAPLISVYLSYTWRHLRLRARARARSEGKQGERAGRGITPAKSMLNLLLAGVIVVTVLVVSAPTLSAAHNAAVQAGRFPAGAVAYLRTHRPAGPMLNSYDWGGYLIWTLYPRMRDYVDGRPDMYGDAFIDRFIRTWHAQSGWQATVRRQGVRLVLVEPGSGLGRALAHTRGWREVYHDRVAVLYER